MMIVKTTGRVPDVSFAHTGVGKNAVPLVDNRLSHGTSTVQRQRNIAAQDDHIAEARRVLELIPDDENLAEKKIIGIKDAAMGAGDHHKNRVVSNQDLRKDVAKRIDDYQAFQVRDQGLLDKGGLKPDKVLQLREVNNRH